KTNSQSFPSDWKNGPKLLEDAGWFDRGWDWWPQWGGLMLPWTEYPGDAEPSGWGGLMLPWTKYPGDAEPSDGRTKKVVRINVE
uniref:hypothetical protein n=1 Tax=Salmonella sp. s57936 TaxID=3159698 RepID=UPI00397F15D9